MIKIYNRLAWLIAALLSVLSAGCVDDTFRFDESGELSDEVTVSFTVGPEAVVSSRSRGDDEQAVPTFISDGSKADMLIYAVYRVVEGENEDEVSFDYLESYGTGVDPKLEGIIEKAGPGQSVVKVDKFPYTFYLNLKRGYKYHIAFWAQSSKTKAFNTLDLRKVEMIYSEVKDQQPSEDTPAAVEEGEGNGEGDDKYVTSTPNNDDFRDAFCKMKEVDLRYSSTNTIKEDVYLYRPLSQVNIGCNGFDFEIVNRMRPQKYTYSKIRIDRVARYLNVVEDRVYHSTTSEDPYGDRTDEAFSVVDYGWAKIPAYYDMDVPDYPTHTIFDWKHNPDYEVKTEGSPITKDNYLDVYGKEEFLKVKRNDHDDILKGDAFDEDGDGKIDYYLYTNDKYGTRRFTHLDDEGKYFAYANYNNHNNYESETYKYLSMCYVLTSSTKDEAILFNNIKMWLSTDGTDATAFEVLSLDNVPAQRNHRTNIVGNLLSVQKDLTITMDTNFGGDYGGWNKNEEWDEYSGPLAEGVYYDAIADEIQISSREGLIWFQRMVNGDLKIRETAQQIHIGDYYFYNIKGGGNNQQLIYEGISKPKDKQLMKRIMRATHQDINDKSKEFGDEDGWPMGNRFHFTDGKKPENRAKVKLMADIDLSGVEWIPIGFEGKILDQMQYLAYDSAPSFKFGGDAKNTYGVKNSNPFVRGFWGEFDGNNHTISNLTTKRFGVMIMDWDQERYTEYTAKDGRKFNTEFRFTDNPQWFARGLFGQIFANSKIRNVRLINPDIKGCNGVGGIVGVAYGDAIEITNCIVDGGSIVATPLYRGDMVQKATTNTAQDRTFARGVFVGGIVGCFNADGGSVNNCQVNNMLIKGYRRVGGLIGSVDLASNTDETANTSNSKSNPVSISNNSVNNTIIIGSSYSIFDKVRPIENNSKLSGFGFAGTGFSLYAQKFIGGDIQDYIDKAPNVCQNNYKGNLTFAEMKIDYIAAGKSNTQTLADTASNLWYGTTNRASEFIETRFSTIQTTPLQYMPLLSSWYSDRIMLNDSYHGQGVAKKVQHLYPFARLSTKPNDVFYYPVFLPYDVDIAWVANQNYNIGLYVESVELMGDRTEDSNSNDNSDNKNFKGTVITPNNVTSPGSAVMFITARDHKAYWTKMNGSSSNPWYKKDTNIYYFVLRGEPYAYNGILLSPNENMKTVNIDNVAIYDVYKTIALDETYLPGDYWPNTKPSAQGVTINASNCNFRGFTVPGKGWQKINYITTTFGNGTYIKEIYDSGKPSEAYTCVVEANTSFKNCYFKAPYVIKKEEGGSWSFESFDGKPCYASGATTANVEINNSTVPADCVAIYIRTDDQGNPTVTYYKKFVDVGSSQNVRCQ